MTRAVQKERTRAALVREARRLFAAEGYGPVGVAAVVDAVGVTKGAFYHHFDGKAGLFRAVLTQVQEDVADAVVAAAGRAPDPWRSFVAGCEAFLAESLHPDVGRIMLVDGPAVLGWDEWRAIDEATSGRHLADALTGLMAAGELAAQPVEPLARLLSGAMNEAALWLAQTGAAELDGTRAALVRLLEGLRVR